MRHWSLTRMLCCPARLPFNPSSRLPGGTAISRNSVAACNCRSFRRAVRWMSVGNRRDTCPRKIFSVSAHAKLSIIAHTTLTHGVNNVKRPLNPLHQSHFTLSAATGERVAGGRVRCRIKPRTTPNTQIHSPQRTQRSQSRVHFHRRKRREQRLLRSVLLISCFSVFFEFYAVTPGILQSVSVSAPCFAVHIPRFE